MYKALCLDHPQGCEREVDREEKEKMRTTPSISGPDDAKP